MKFAKMHGLGNDFILLARREVPPDVNQLAVTLCDRHFGIGADGLVFILPSEKADVRMRIFNADGTEAENCGNAIRCVGKYVYDHALLSKSNITVETLAGLKELTLHVEEGRVKSVTVDMGLPILNGREIPTLLEGEMIVNHPLRIGERELSFTAVSMGNPHAVFFVEDLNSFPVEEIGPLIEHHSLFPARTNAEFVTVENRREMTMRVWERGAGQTLACGTGACATLVSGVLNGLVDREAILHLAGGDLLIRWDEESGHLFMTGPAVLVFQGEWEPES
ncbi:diaminopimelate epimerase [Thermicanus aegyptius]|uniref:diaminopimelate epimerase n=1 Tax=Thermicanus aegyptius TaxID=94009 RepID=UPI0003F8DC7E|nr:diaminopimelate epimerase [Thermicanus aegyptius]